MVKKNSTLILIFILVLALLVFSTVFYLSNSEDLGRRGSLVGDGVCGNIPQEDGQDFCCEKAHEGDQHILCVGGWEYVSGMATCQYVCSEGLPSCTEDARVCPDGETVVRNPELECEFDACE